MADASIKVTVDIVILTIREGALAVLLVKRGIPPFKGRWAIPGGFVLPGESIDHAALRELGEETGVADVFLEQLRAFGDPGRDPRGPTVTIAYFALVRSDRAVSAGSDAADAAWFDATTPPPLAFDHGKILGCALDRLRADLDRTTVGFELLPPKFTLSELQSVHEAVLGWSLDKRNFRRKIETLGFVVPTSETRSAGRRPARLFRFRRD